MFHQRSRFLKYKFNVVIYEQSVKTLVDEGKDAGVQ